MPKGAVMPFVPLNAEKDMEIIHTTDAWSAEHCLVNLGTSRLIRLLTGAQIISGVGKNLISEVSTMNYAFISKDKNNNIIFISPSYAVEDHCRGAAAQYCIDEQRDVFLIYGNGRPSYLYGKMLYRNGTARWKRAVKSVKMP